MHPGILLATFALIFVAELPDKTMIAVLILGSRNRPWSVWLGATAAFAVHVTAAVAAGRLLQLLPHRWVEGITAALFAAGAAYLLLVSEKETAEHEAERVASSPRGLRTVGTAFVVILVGELGDLTQILTANLAAKYHSPASVFVGALAALTGVAALGAFAGRALVRVLPLATIRRTGGVLLAGFAVYSFVTAVWG